jgi:site-specific recombinase XerD
MGSARSSADRASASGAVGRGFKSLRARQTNSDKVLSSSIPEESLQKADAHFQNAIEAFLLSRGVGNCSGRTLQTYTVNLTRFQQGIECAALERATSLLVQRYLTGLQATMKPVSLHQHFRTLRTFFRWCIEAGLLAETPMRGLTMKAPKTLPRVPEDETVQRLLAACPETFEGRRNRALSWPMGVYGSLKRSA